MIKYVLHPRGIITTPRLLKENLNARYLVRDLNSRYRDYASTFFTSYSGVARELDESRRVPSNLLRLIRFYSSSKYSQRKEIGLCGVGVPPSAVTSEEAANLPDYGLGFVQRPLNHRGGAGWERLSTPSVSPGTYVSPIFPKYREYRLIYVLGEPLVVLRKQSMRDENGRIDPTVPWNHAQGSSFVTVENEENDHTLRTSLREDLARFDIVQMSDLIGVDVMLDRYNNYQVCEFNTCPALTIESNLQKVVTHVHSVFSDHRQQ